VQYTGYILIDGKQEYLHGPGILKTSQVDVNYIIVS